MRETKPPLQHPARRVLGTRPHGVHGKKGSQIGPAFPGRLSRRVEPEGRIDILAGFRSRAIEHAAGYSKTPSEDASGDAVSRADNWETGARCSRRSKAGKGEPRSLGGSCRIPGGRGGRQTFGRSGTRAGSGDDARRRATTGPRCAARGFSDGISCKLRTAPFAGSHGVIVAFNTLSRTVMASRRPRRIRPAGPTDIGSQVDRRRGHEATRTLVRFMPTRRDGTTAEPVLGPGIGHAPQDP